MDQLQNTLIQEGLAFVYQPKDIVLNMTLGFCLGLVISFVYKATHKGLSYSQSFMLTIVFVTFIVSMVMMVIGNNLARAFALVGALSIIRFRTVIKDTKDTAYVFMALAGGMAAGTSSYFLAVSGTVIFVVISFLLHVTNYGSLYKSEFILRFRSARGENDDGYAGLFDRYTKTASLLLVEPSGDQLSARLTFDVVLKKDQDAQAFSAAVSELDEVSEVTLVASKSDVDY